MTDHVLTTARAVPRSLTIRLAAGLRRALPARAPANIVYTPPLLAAFAVCVVTATVVAVALCRAPADWTTLGMLVAVILAISFTSVRMETQGDHLWSASTLLQLGLTLALGPVGALSGALAEAAGPFLRVRNGWFRASFNVANIFLSDIAAWKVYALTIGSADPPAAREVAAGLLAGSACWLVNHGLLLAIFASMKGRRSDPLRFARLSAGHLPYNAAYGFAALAFPLLFAAHGAVGVSMAVVPIAAAQAFLVLLDRQRRGIEAERAAHIADLEESNVRIEIAHHVTLIALTNALDARDRETLGHSRRVVEYSREIGDTIGLSGDDMRVLAYGALLHDIGKIGIPDSVLHKPGKLTVEEWDVMHTHPEIGAQMIDDVDGLREARRIILHHHERWDGGGYPRGLRGGEIVRGARIFAVADAVDAMTQDRPYRAAMGWEQALAEVQRCSGGQFDPEAVEALLALPVGRLLDIAALRQPPQIDLLTTPPAAR